MKKPDRILDAFKTKSDTAARRVAELRDARDRTLKAQVQVRLSIEDAFNVSSSDRDAAVIASSYAQRALRKAGELQRAAEHLSMLEAGAREELLDRFADQKRFELYMAQRQLKERAVERRREEKKLVDELGHLTGKLEWDDTP
jgi:hypothetical protein